MVEIIAKELNPRKCEMVAISHRNGNLCSALGWRKGS